MDIQFSRDQQSFVREAIATGRIVNEEEAVRQALSLWEERERVRVEMLSKISRAHESVARGEGRRINSEDDLRQLASDVKQRGLARLRAEPIRS
ncbi:MAG: hypothetical protein EBY17_00545 [Acidobacteriia bacterium]|nr:hypothetical protein [Terriglobia bacterium]